MKHLFTLAVYAIAMRPASAQLSETCLLVNAGFVATSVGGAVQTPDGGVAMAGGHSLSNSGYSDVLVTKLDANGALQWMRTYSMGAFSADYGRMIINTDDGGLAISGDLPTGEIFLLKVDAAGNPQWAKTYDDPDPNALTQTQNGLIQMSDGGYALHMEEFGGLNDWHMLRTDEQGNVLWSDELDHAGGKASDLAELPNGDLVFIGHDGGFGDPQLLLRKDGLTGTTEWMRWYIAGNGGDLEPYSIVIAPDSTIVISGAHVGSTVDACLYAFSPDGVPLWSTSISTPDNERAQGLARAQNGDYVVCGRMTQDTTLYPDMGAFVARLTATGQPIWSKHLTHPGFPMLWTMHAAMANDGGILLSGYFANPVYYPLGFLKLDANGNSCPYCPSVDTGTPDTLDIILAPDGGYQFIGPWAGSTDITFMLDSITGAVDASYCGVTGWQETAAVPKVSVVPNPFVEQAVLTVEGNSFDRNTTLVIRDVAGRTVRTQPVTGPGTVIDRGALSAGHYVFSVLDGNVPLTHGVLQVVPK